MGSKGAGETGAHVAFVRSEITPHKSLAPYRECRGRKRSHHGKKTRTAALSIGGDLKEVADFAVELLLALFGMRSLRELAGPPRGEFRAVLGCHSPRG